MTLNSEKKRFIANICKYKIVRMCIKWMVKSYNLTKQNSDIKIKINLDISIKKRIKQHDIILCAVYMFACI